MLGRAETSTSTVPTAAAVDPTADADAAVKTMTTSSTAARPWTPTTTTTTTPTTIAVADGDHRGRTQPPPPTVSASPWPSSDWILETVEQIEAAARARGIRAGGAPGVDPFDYDDGGDDDDDADDEIEEIEEPTTAAPATVPPPPPRIASGHMSRYLFRRIDGRPGDGRVNGTYVAVVESDRPPHGVVYDTVSPKQPLHVTFSLIFTNNIIERKDLICIFVRL